MRYSLVFSFITLFSISNPLMSQTGEVDINQSGSTEAGNLDVNINTLDNRSTLGDPPITCSSVKINLCSNFLNELKNENNKGSVFTSLVEGNSYSADEVCRVYANAIRGNPEASPDMAIAAKYNQLFEEHLGIPIVPRQNQCFSNNNRDSLEEERKNALALTEFNNYFYGIQMSKKALLDNLASMQAAGAPKSMFADICVKNPAVQSQTALDFERDWCDKIQDCEGVSENILDSKIENDFDNSIEMANHYYEFLNNMNQQIADQENALNNIMSRCNAANNIDEFFSGYSSTLSDQELSETVSEIAGLPKSNDLGFESLYTVGRFIRADQPLRTKLERYKRLEDDLRRKPKYKAWLNFKEELPYLSPAMQEEKFSLLIDMTGINATFDGSNINFPIPQGEFNQGYATPITNFSALEANRYRYTEGIQDYMENQNVPPRIRQTINSMIDASQAMKVPCEDEVHRLMELKGVKKSIGRRLLDTIKSISPNLASYIEARATNENETPPLNKDGFKKFVKSKMREHVEDTKNTYKKLSEMQHCLVGNPNELVNPDNCQTEKLLTDLEIVPAIQPFTDRSDPQHHFVKSYNDSAMCARSQRVNANAMRDIEKNVAMTVSTSFLTLGSGVLLRAAVSGGRMGARLYSAHNSLRPIGRIMRSLGRSRHVLRAGRVARYADLTVGAFLQANESIGHIGNVINDCMSSDEQAMVDLNEAARNFQLETSLPSESDNPFLNENVCQSVNGDVSEVENRIQRKASQCGKTAMVAFANLAPIALTRGLQAREIITKTKARMNFGDPPPGLGRALREEVIEFVHPSVGRLNSSLSDSLGRNPASLIRGGDPIALPSAVTSESMKRTFRLILADRARRNLEPVTDHFGELLDKGISVQESTDSTTGIGSTHEIEGVPDDVLDFRSLDREEEEAHQQFLQEMNY